MSELALDWTQIWPVVRDISSWILFLLGSAAVVTGAIGVIRFPDFYSRMHAAGITDTAGAELMVLAMALHAPNWQVVAKLAFVAIFLFFTSPVSTHAVAHAAWLVGQKPLLGKDLKREGDQ
ncbi:MAG TPA: monovalent cation/H(+) antiporter subunit G [Parvularculaceae bacterium]|nr:monovalent cation/H(+) antiporter subunit G [Amphiplicatus sp.]HOP18826.1 monovalent cation/H(+) antiporter subunit G [Amphiplicatus sp.]HPE30474.1 monovalent cation/H(+) antiporter subunit G [Parvularculaceae bacterium]HRX39896.1 monovalent cation/H(+) antiporter subunit G [Parvularculaceae bacterium]